MKNKFIIREYLPSDNQAALQLEERCPQGEKLKISFHRKSFHQRSEMYKDYLILAGYYDKKLVSLVAGAVKEILINKKKVKAGYKGISYYLNFWRKPGWCARLSS